MKFRHLLSSVAGVFLPRTCPVCSKPLDLDEKFLCRKCLMNLPRTHYEEIDFNAFEQLMAGKVPVERCASLFYYRKSDPYASILHDIKYRHVPTMGRWLASYAARDMMATGFFDSIDAIVPVPLHFTKLAERGYNQSRYIAQGIGEVIDRPVVQALRAVREHSTQTHKDALERQLNIQNTFAVSARKAAGLHGKHLLLVDDVVTTGSTLLVCARELLNSIPGVRLSLFTLAAAHLE